jgi:hypothetical protein
MIVTVPSNAPLLYISTGNGVVESVEKYKACLGLLRALDLAAIGANQCSVSLCAKRVLMDKRNNTKLSRNLFMCVELGFLQI